MKLIKTNTSVYILAILILFFGCDNGEVEPSNPSIPLSSGNSNDSTSSDTEDQWLINKEEIYDGGPGKDGIPAIENPVFIEANEADYLSEEDLVIGYVKDGIIRAYPHRILDWHEITNDAMNGKSVSIIYCPLTGTATAWDRNTSAGITTFGVSGLLYNSNIIPYDRKTDSNWSQIHLKAVNGKLLGEKPSLLPIVETTWKTWKALYPSTKVLSTETGSNRNYDRYPYGDYKTSEFTIFPVRVEDSRFHAKDRVLTVIFGEEAKSYPLEVFGNGIKIIEEKNFHDVIIVGSTQYNFAIAFKNETTEADNVEFSAVTNQFPIVMEDSGGNTWDVFGEAQSGPRKGERLAFVDQMIGFWFSFPSFFDDLKVYE